MLPNKTSTGLVEHLKTLLLEPSIYMHGGFGRILSQEPRAWFHSIDSSKARPNSFTIANEARIRQGIGRKCYDCVGIIKNYLWFNPDKTFPYSIEFDNPDGSDRNANGMYTDATKKGLFATMPDVPGTLVFIHNGTTMTHVGVYIGKNSQGLREYIESTPGLGFWGVGKSNDTMRKWTHWGYHNLITYIEPAPKPVVTAKTYTVIKGDTLSRIGNKVGATWQQLYDLNKDVIGADYNKIEVGMILRLDPNVVFVEKVVTQEVIVEKLIPISAKFTDGVVEVIVKTL